MGVSALLTMTLAGRGSGPLSTRQADGTSKVCQQQTPVSSIPNSTSRPASGVVPLHGESNSLNTKPIGMGTKPARRTGEQML